MLASCQLAVGVPCIVSCFFVRPLAIFRFWRPLIFFRHPFSFCCSLNVIAHNGLLSLFCLHVCGLRQPAVHTPWFAFVCSLLLSRHADPQSPDHNCVCLAMSGSFHCSFFVRCCDSALECFNHLPFGFPQPQILLLAELSCAALRSVQVPQLLPRKPQHNSKLKPRPLCPLSCPSLSPPCCCKCAAKWLPLSLILLRKSKK